jgi:hypothetical protein
MTKHRAMKKRTLKKILIGAGSTVLLLFAVLCIHIYLVTRPKAPDANTRIMARIDFKQDISQQDADKIAGWLYAQSGVSHVLCNPESNTAIFTFAPVKTTADAVVNGLNTALPYKGVRFMPSEEDMKKGCPVATNSFTYKLFSIFKHS